MNKEALITAIRAQQYPGEMLVLQEARDGHRVPEAPSTFFTYWVARKELRGRQR
jgi:hypothetical protein